MRGDKCVGQESGERRERAREGREKRYISEQREEKGES